MWLTILTVLAGATEFSPARAREVLFLDQTHALRCEDVPCLLAARYAKDPSALKTAVDLFQSTGSLAGVLAEQDFDGGYRGQLHLVPRVPVGALRYHLVWVAHALKDFDTFFARLGGEPKFRWRDLELRFFESVKRRTPSAFAVDWVVAYNVSGSLFGSEAAVRSTLFHEVFHLNDQAHQGWSTRALSRIYGGLVAKCGTDARCLEPYTPDTIKVRGGTYYDFQPGNGVHEYAADVARRYYGEHRALFQGERLGVPFKCRRPENAEAWKLVVDEFFGGVDLVTCSGSR